MNPNHDHYPEGESFRRSLKRTLSHRIHLAGTVLLRISDRHAQPCRAALQRGGWRIWLCGL